MLLGHEVEVVEEEGHTASVAVAVVVLLLLSTTKQKTAMMTVVMVVATLAAAVMVSYFSVAAVVVAKKGRARSRAREGLLRSRRLCRRCRRWTSPCSTGTRRRRPLMRAGGRPMGPGIRPRRSDIGSWTNGQ